jgi:hypothetical protein
VPVASLADSANMSKMAWPGFTRASISMDELAAKAIELVFRAPLGEVRNRVGQPPTAVRAPSSMAIDRRSIW